MKRMIIASTSTIHGGTYLSYMLDELAVFFKDVNTITFIPYARPGGITHDDYTAKAAEAFDKIGKTVVGLHTAKDPVATIANAEAIFTGGGNTFLLVTQLYTTNVMKALQQAVLNGALYLGTSAGSNITGISMKTTNDMPIVYPPSFDTLGLVPFNINPHYLDPDTTSKHMGETRETRIKEFHFINTEVVVGLREGSWLAVEGDVVKLRGNLSARIFKPNEAPYELATNSEVKF